MRLKLDPDCVGWSSLLEQRTGAGVKDCFQDEETVYFVIAPGQMGKAIGKGGMHIQRLQQELQKKVKMIEYNEQPAEFVRNVIQPLRVEEVVEEAEAIILKDRQKKTKGLLIGREGKNLKVLNRAVQRFFNKEVKVV